MPRAFTKPATPVSQPPAAPVAAPVLPAVVPSGGLDALAAIATAAATAAIPTPFASEDAFSYLTLQVWKPVGRSSPAWNAFSGRYPQLCKGGAPRPFLMLAPDNSPEGVVPLDALSRVFLLNVNRFIVARHTPTYAPAAISRTEIRGVGIETVDTLLAVVYGNQDARRAAIVTGRFAKASLAWVSPLAAGIQAALTSGWLDAEPLEKAERAAVATATGGATALRVCASLTATMKTPKTSGRSPYCHITGAVHTASLADIAVITQWLATDEGRENLRHCRSQFERSVDYINSLPVE